MRRFALPLLSLVLLLGSCNSGENEKKLQEENQALKLELSNTQTQYSEALTILDDVEAGFQKIREAERFVNIESSSETSLSKRQKIEGDISMITQTLQKNREQLEKLKALSANNSQLKGLVDRLTKEVESKTQMIVSLQEELAKKDIRIGELDRSVAALNTQVGEMQEEGNKQRSTIKEQDQELNRAWYVYGKKSELKDQNILSGGGLFRSKEVMKGDFNKDIFNSIDIRNFELLELPAKKAKLLTTHPEDSYTLGKDANGMMVLSINNFQLFWSLSRYLVIELD
ncbi:MAG: hypothetical protein ACRC6R_09485 [Bacteroidales bacterium]